MKAVLYILLAALLTFASSYSLGALLIRVLRIRLFRSEERFFSFVVGSALLSTLVFAMTAAGFARKSAFVAATAPFIALAIWKRLYRAAGEALPAPPLFWRMAFWGGFSAFTYVYVANALLPETSPDGVAYHVALVARYAREHSFPRITDCMYANLSQGAEMLFLYAFSIGRHTAAAMCEFLFLLALPFGMLSYARRIGHPRAGVVAALLAYTSPVVGRTGTIAYVDVAAAVVAFALFYALQIWREQPTLQVAAVAGVLAGFGFAIKYTSAVGVVYLLLLLAWISLRQRRALFRTVAVAGLCAASMSAPWLIKNAIFVSNPFSPFLNRWFPNPYVYASFESSYVDLFRHMNGVTPPEIPLEATVRGARLQGLAGPVFLLAPLALLALRRREGRQILLAAAAYLLPYSGNIGTRFLIPALPLVALAFTLAIERFRGIPPLVLGAHLFLSWPTVIPAYAAEYSWRIEGTRWADALRFNPEDETIRKTLQEYDVGKMLERHVPADQSIFSPSVGGRAYHRRNVFIGYESAFGNRIQDMLYRVTSDDLRPTRRHTHRFAPISARRVRVVQTRSIPVPVEISEIRVFAAGAEIPRETAWRLRASANPWDVQLAFDNSPVTVWMPGRDTTPGTFVEIDFGGLRTLDSLTADLRQDQSEPSSRIVIDKGDGKWQTVSEEPVVARVDWPPRMRRAAVEEMERQGVHWILVRQDDLMAEDFSDRPHQWGIREVAFVNGYHLWRLE